MPSAIATISLAPADLEARLAALGIPVDRLIAASRIARSTWSAWRAGRTRPRADRWAAATAAFDALVAEAAPVPATCAPTTLTGSSAPTGAPPSFTAIATARPEAAPDEERRHPSRAGAGPATDPILHLHQEWLAKRDDFRHGDFPSAREDEMFERVMAVEERVVASRATTLAGAITSLEWALSEFVEHKNGNILGDDLIMALLEGALSVLRQREGTSAPAAPAEVTALTAEWLVSGSAELHAAAAYDACETPGPEWEAVQARYAAANGVNEPVLRRIAALRSCHPDALALKAAVVVRGFEGEVRLQKNVEDREEVELNPLEVSVALSIVRDLAHGLGQVRLLTAAIAADPGSAATGAPADERAAA